MNCIEEVRFLGTVSGLYQPDVSKQDAGQYVIRFQSADGIQAKKVQMYDRPGQCPE